jgi:hypothetical protein
MSIVRICDCDCHDDPCMECGGGAEVIEGEFNTFGDRDVCQQCLVGYDGRGCRYWSAYASMTYGQKTPPLVELVAQAYEAQLRASLLSEPLFRKFMEES